MSETSSGVSFPRLPDAPQEYSQRYMTDLLRALQVIVSKLENPGPVRAQSILITGSDTLSPDLSDGALQASTVNLTDLPTSSAGLSTGDLFNDSGVVKIVT